MPTLENLTKTDLNKVLKPKNLSKAHGYLSRIQNPVRVGQILKAEVAGSQLYEVEIDVGLAGITAHCSCSYNWGGYCKHVGAVLLKWLQSPNVFAVKDGVTVSRPSSIEVIPVQPPQTYRPQTVPFWMTTSAASRQQLDQKQLEQWLEQLKVQDLRQMAKKRSWSIKGASKADLIWQIVEAMLKPDDILKVIRSLDAEHWQVLRAMVLLGKEEGVQLKDLERVATSWGSLTSYEQVTIYTRHLAEIGLALPGPVAASYVSQMDFIPRAIASHLPPVLAEVIPATTDLPSQQRGLSEFCPADPYPLVRTASQVALLLEQSPVQLRPPMPRPRLEKLYPALTEWDYDPQELLAAKTTGKFQTYSDLTLTVPPPQPALPDEAMGRLMPAVGDEARLEFVFALLVAAGLFQPGSPATVWPEVKEQFLRQDELAQRAVLARVYFQMQNWSELWALLRANQTLQLKRSWVNPNLKPKHLLADLVRFRQLVLRVLACLPDDKWIALNDLFPLMRVVWPRFDQTVWQTYWSPSFKPGWFLARNGSPLRPAEDWQVAQWAFIRQIISGPLHWLGLADLSFQEGVLVAVRLHGLADLYWDRVETLAAPDHAAQTLAALPTAVVVADEYSITVDPTAISVQAHSLLDRIARLDDVAPGRFVYYLDPRAAHAAFEDGVALSEILTDWERLLVIPMPEAIRTRLVEWWQAYGQARIYEKVTLIEFGDDYALAEMKAVTSLEQQLIAEISPRLVLIPLEAVNLLTAELEKAGYTPKQTEQV